MKDDPQLRLLLGDSETASDDARDPNAPRATAAASADTGAEAYTRAQSDGQNLPRRRRRRTQFNSTPPDSDRDGVPPPPPKKPLEAKPVDPVRAHFLRLRDVVGRPALAKYEALGDYDEIYYSLCDALQPADIIEVSYVKDLADGFTAINRYKRVMNSHLTARARDGVHRILWAASQANDPDDIFEGNAKKFVAVEVMKMGPERHPGFQASLKRLGLPIAAITDFAILGNLNSHLSIHKLLEDSLRRNDRTIRALAIYRDHRLSQIVSVNAIPVGGGNAHDQ